MNARLTILLGLVLVLAGCASMGPQPPAHLDAFKGIFNQSAAGVPADVPVSVQPPVGIVFSDNFEAWFKFINDSNAYYGKIIPASLTNTVAQADGDPHFISGRVLEVLKRRFPTAVVVNDFPQAVAAGKKAVILVDLRARLMQPYSDRTTRIGIDVYFFDAGMNPVSKLSGDGERYVAFGAGDLGIQVATDGALAQIETKFGRSVR